MRPELSLLSLSKLVKPIARESQTLLHLLTVEHKNGDLGATVTAELAQVRQIFTKADEFYRYYREALLNREHHRKELKPTEWIPISEHE